MCFNVKACDLLTMNYNQIRFSRSFGQWGSLPVSGDFPERARIEEQTGRDGIATGSDGKGENFMEPIALRFEPRISIITLGVADMSRAIRFYRDGLGFPTNASDDDDWAIFRTNGTRFALYPRHKLAADIGPDIKPRSPGFGGITLAHNARDKSDVEALLSLAQQAGGHILKKAQPAEWGGFSGYFADPDGYPWEVAWGEVWKFAEDGTIWGGSLGDPVVL